MSEPKKTKVCPICGKTFEVLGRKTYRSVKCRNVEINRRAASRRRKKGICVKPVPAPPDPVFDCPKDCKYRSVSTKTCDYMLITGQPRECDARPGGCDKYSGK